MGFAVELYFDSPMQAAVRALRAKLADLGIPSVLDQLGDRPHISLQLFSQLDPDVFTPQLEEFAARFSPFPLRLVRVDCFRSQEGVLFLAPEMTPALRQIHADFHQTLAPLGAPPASDYYLPGKWVPHCTIAQGLKPDMLSQTVETCRRIVTPLAGEAREIGLVRYPPVQPICTFPLGLASHSDTA